MADAANLTELVRARLSAAGCVAADEEAAELLAAAGRAGPEGTRLEEFVRRRQRGEPLAWITGSQEFCGRRVAVEPGVYVPRRQTEVLAHRAVDHLPPDRPARAADLCTGAGAVAVHLMAARRGATAVGVDVDPRAVACARHNGVPAVLADLRHGAPPLRPGAFDVVTAVAPYVPSGDLRLLPADVLRYEPRRALDGGTDGLNLVRQVVAGASGLLRSGGWLLLEVGGEQDRAVGQVLAGAGFGRAEAWSDEDGDLRGMEACMERHPLGGAPAP